VTAAHRFRDPLVGTLRVGVIPTISPYWLPALVPRLRERYPRLTLVWSEDKTVSVLRDLGAGRLDAVLVAHVSGMEDFEREMLEAELTATSLFTLTQMVAGSAAITLLPQLALAVERRRSALAIRRFAAPVPGRTLVLAWRRQSPFRAALRALAGAMRAPAAARPHRREPGAPRTTRPNEWDTA
jgi:LysR family hydrogen peroxide-inducible transcriptional activator